MSRTTSAWLVVVIAGPGTFAIRATLLLGAQRFGQVPPRFREALRMIPPAALGALAIPAILRPGAGSFDVADARFVAGLVALLVAWRTRSLLLTTVVGVALVTALEQLGGIG